MSDEDGGYAEDLGQENFEDDYIMVYIITYTTLAHHI